MSVPPDPHRTPEEILAAFLEAHSEPSRAEVEALYAEHSDHAADLRDLFKAHRAVGAAFPSTLDEGVPGLHRAARPSSAPAASGFRVSEGMTLGDFTLVQILGRGGMGEVWEAEQLSLSRRVALKLLLPERVDSKGLDFFAREARAGGRLSHPGIVAIHGTGQDEGLHWIAMELVEDACDLRRALDGMREEDELPGDYYEQSALFLAETADALEVAHAAGVIHRDLKPANILVTPDDHPKVSDFGLAKLTDEHSISLAGDLVGTYFYMSPEQVAAKRMGLDHRTDVFSLGVVLYEMLTLVRPFEGDTTEQVAHKILVVDPPPPNELRSKVPGDLAVICGKAMEKDPERRYTTMAELAADLRRHLADEPILARPPGTLERAVKWARRNPTKSAVAGVAAAALVVISWLGLVATENAERAEDNAALAEKSAELATQRAETLEERGRELAKANTDLKERSQELAEANADLVEERDRADTNAKLAEEQRAEAEQRAEELEQVAKFQEEQLSGIDVQSMGWSIRRRVLEGARAAGERVKRDEEVLDLQAVELEKLVAGTDFTGIALGTLDEHVFEGALKALEGFEEQPLLQARLLQTVASTLQELGLFERALAPQEKSLEIRQREMGEEHPDTLSAAAFHARLISRLGEEETAEILHGQVLSRSRRILGDLHEDTLRRISDQAHILKKRARYDAAEPLMAEFLERCQQAFGSDHALTLEAFADMGNLLAATGRFDAAEEFLLASLEGRRRILGEDHASTLQTNFDMGYLRVKQDRPDEAETMFRVLLGKRQRILGHEHPHTLSTVSALGACLYSQGKADQSERYILESLEGYRRILGPNHARTLGDMNNFGLMLHARGEFARAVPYLEGALAGLRQTRGNKHVDTCLTMCSNAALMCSLGQFHEAETLFREALESQRTLLQPDHPDLMRSVYGVAYALISQDQHQEAEPFVLEYAAMVPTGDQYRSTRAEALLKSIRKHQASVEDEDKSGDDQ